MSERQRKPWYRPRTFALAFLAAVLALGGYALWFAYTARPGTAIDYAAKMNELARARQPGDPDAPNRWDEYKALLKECNEIVKGFEADRFWEIRKDFGFQYYWDADDLTPEEHAVARADVLDCLTLVRESGLFEQIGDLAARGRVFREFDSNELLLFSSMEDLGWSRALSRALRCEFHAAIDQNDNDRAVESVRIATDIAAVSLRGVTLVQCLVGAAQQAMILEGIRAEVLDGRIGRDAAIATLAVLNDLPPVTMEWALGGERCFMHQMIQRTHTDDGRGNGTYLPREFTMLDLTGAGTPAASPHPIVNALGLVYPDKKTTMAKADDYYDSLTRRARMTPPARRAAGPDPEQFLESRLGWGDILLKMLLPAISRAISHADQANLDLGATRILLALAIHHADHGAYPDTLDELAPDILAELPKDPFAPDGRFRYLTRTPTPDDPREFILYSVGADENDDDGLFADNRRAMNRTHGQPLDYVFNPPPSPAPE